MSRRLVIALLWPVLLVAAARLCGPASAAAPRQEAEAAAGELARLQESFQNLFRSLQVKGGIAEQDKPVIESLRDRVAAYRPAGDDERKHALAMELQLSIWLREDDRVDELFGRLVKLEPDSPRFGEAWVSYFERRNDQERVERIFARLVKEYPGDLSIRAGRAAALRDRNHYAEAIALLDDPSFDLASAARASLVLSDCLFAEQEFQRAADVLRAVTEEARRADHAAAQQIDVALPMRAPYPDLWEAEQAIRAAEQSADDLPRAELVTARGRVVVELFENEAPNTVANFIKLADEGFYDGTRFHRVIGNFMVQGGDPNSRPESGAAPGSGGPGYRIPDEHGREGARQHFTGSLAMANVGSPNSGGSQFYLAHTPLPHLNGRHTVFGRVLEGLEVVRAIEKDDELATVRILRRRDHPYEPQTIPTEAARGTVPATLSQPRDGAPASVSDAPEPAATPDSAGDPAGEDPAGDDPG